MNCPYCQSTLLWSEDRGPHCDGCEEFDGSLLAASSGSTREFQDRPTQTQTQMLDLLNQAKNEIENLRRENSILRAKAEVVDIFAGAIFGNRQSDPQPMAPDTAWMLKREIDRQTPRPATSDKLSDALAKANDICRSMHAIAERAGEETNWEAFRNRLDAALKEQHAIMFPTVQPVEN